MSGYSQPIYMSGPAPTPSMLASSSNQNRNQNQNQNQNTAHNMKYDDSAIEPSLAGLLRSPNMYQQSSSGQMSPDQETAFQLQLQAAAVAASEEGLMAQQQQEMLTPDQHALKQRRLGRACDACSKRKVKCGEEIPCKHCVDLAIPCTFARPAKRRGPANKVAEELKKARFESDDLQASSTSNQNQGAYLSIEAVAPIDTIHQILFDFFTYIHPIFPFPHEHLTMDRLRKREDIQNRSFCALIAALVATTSTIFPRIAHKSLRQNEQGGPIISNDVFIGRCLLTCQQSRSPLASGRDVDDAATSFFIGLVSFLRKLPGQLELYMTEALSIVHYLGVAREGFIADGTMADPVTKELSKRIFWAVYSLSRSLQQTGEIQDLIPPRRESQLPALPQLTDDYYIYKDRIQPQPHGQLSTIEGFSILASIYSSFHALIKFDLLDDEDRESDSSKEEECSFIRTLLQHLDSLLAGGHPELANIPSPSVFEIEEQIPGQQARMHLRWESQKIVLRAAIIRTRHYLVERLAEVQGSDEEPVPEMRKKCLSDFAVLTANVTKASLEPVGKLVVPYLQKVLHELRKMPEGVKGGDPDLVLILSRSGELFGEWFNET